MFYGKKIALGLFSLVSVGVVTPSYALLIDGFTDTSIVQNSTVGTTVWGTVAIGGILGGDRESSANVLTNPFGSSINMSITTLNGKHAMSNGAFLTGTHSMIWDGIGGTSGVNNLGLGGVDVTDGGVSNRLNINVDSTDVGTALTLTFYGSTLTNFATLTRNLQAPISTPTDVGLLFSSLTVTGTQSLNQILTSVNAIELTIDASINASADIIFNFVETKFVAAPVPSSVWMLLSGIGLIGWLRYRRC